jgi:hypothetical protein
MASMNMSLLERILLVLMLLELKRLFGIQILLKVEAAGFIERGYPKEKKRILGQILHRYLS